MSAKDRIELALKILVTFIALFGVWKYFADRHAHTVADRVAVVTQVLGDMLVLF